MCYWQLHDFTMCLTSYVTRPHPLRLAYTRFRLSVVSWVILYTCTSVHSYIFEAYLFAQVEQGSRLLNIDSVSVNEAHQSASSNAPPFMKWLGVALLIMISLNTASLQSFNFLEFWLPNICISTKVYRVWRRPFHSGIKNVNTVAYTAFCFGRHRAERCLKLDYGVVEYKPTLSVSCNPRALGLQYRTFSFISGLKAENYRKRDLEPAKQLLLFLH